MPQRVIAALAQQLQRLAERSPLRIADSSTAVNHLAWLMLGGPLDAAMFGADGEGLAADALDRSADVAVDVFLAAYH